MLNTVVGAVLLPAAGVALLVFGDDYLRYFSALAYPCGNLDSPCGIEVSAPPLDPVLWTLALGVVCLVVGLVGLVGVRRPRRRGRYSG